MDNDNYKFRYDAYKNNTFNLGVVEDTLQEAKMSSYQYLRDFQLESTGYRRFDFKMQEIYKTNKVNHKTILLPRRWVFFIEYEFINVGKRLAYKRSNLYEKDLSFEDISARPDLFDSTFLLFINGNLYTKGAKILCKEDKTYLILNCREDPSPEGFTITEMKEYIENNVDVTIYFIPNVGVKNIRSNAYRVRTMNNGDGMPYRNLGLSEIVDYNNTLAYVNHVGSIESIPTSVSIEPQGMYVDSRVVDYILNVYPNNSAIDIQLIPLRNLLFKIHNKPGNKWFEIPMQDYPVAVDNCLIMDSNGKYLHKAKINHYYPNIYSIDGVDDIINKNDIFIYVFYYENKLNQIKHLDMLASYHKYVPNYLDKYKDGTIPDLIKQFSPKIVEYSIKDYKRELNLIERDPGLFIKSNNGKIYHVYIDDYQLFTESVDIDDKDIPEFLYVYDANTNIRYKIYMEDSVVTTDIVTKKVDTSITYIYDKTNREPFKLGTYGSVLALFEYIGYEDHFKYKINKMKEFIQADVNNFRRYLRNLGLGNNYYYVDVAKIDLQSRIRRNNADTKLKPVEFEQDMYMFVFRNDFRGMYDQLIIHVDGIRYHGLDVFKTDMLDYLYIPCDVVKPDSIIEIEKITSVMKEYRLKSERISDIINIDLGDFAVRNKTLYNDLFMIDRITGELIDPKMYQIILPVDIRFDDHESDIVLDYILSETDNGYYYIKGLEYGEVDLVRHENVEDGKNIYYLKAEDDNERAVYQFDVINDDLTFKKTNEYGNIVNKVRSSENENIVYEFSIVNGIVKINVIEANSLKKDDFVGYGGLDLLELGEIFLPCTRNIKLRLIDKSLLNRDLMLMIKKNHKVEYLELETEIDELNPIKSKTVSKNDPRYFRIYRNGRLVPRHYGCVSFISDDSAKYYEMEIYPGFVREHEDEVVVECMPYMMNQVCYLSSIPDDDVVNLTGKIDKPFDFKWFDIYLNGRKLAKRDVEIISANRIRILKSDSVKSLEIIENSRDEEYFGVKSIYDILDKIYDADEDFSGNLKDEIKNDDNFQDVAPPSIKDPVNPLNYILKEFYDILTNSFGMINPDELQLTRGMVEKFGDLSRNKNIFELNPDAVGKEDCIYILEINPDNK